MLETLKQKGTALKTATLCFLLAAGVAVAQQQDSNNSKPDKATSTAEQKKQNTAKAKSKDKAKAKKNNERFVPTEEISEDLPIAFPVDI